MSEQILNIPGPVGSLEAAFMPVPDAKTIAVICHPNPLQGGTMTNKVVTTTARALQDLGLSTVRFNYRGVSNSEGEYGDVVGEIDDCKAILQWLDQKHPGHNYWLIGFSFGAYIAASTALQRDDVKQIISIAPAVHLYEYDNLPTAQVPWLVIQGEADEVVPVDQVYAWIDRSPSVIQLIKMPDTSHFFHGKLIELREILKETLVKAA